MKQNRRQVWLSRLLLGIGVLGLILIFWLPLPYYLESPGSAEPVSQYVKINGKQEHHSGHYLLTTVAIRQATPFWILVGHFQPATDILSKAELMGDSSNDAYLKLQQYYIENSENTAVAQASKLAKQAYHLQFRGIYVLDILANSNFKKKLQLGDNIRQINHLKFKSSTGFQKYVRHRKVGTKVTLNFLRGKKAKVTSGKLISLPGTKIAGLGITLTDRTKVTTKIPIKVDAGDIGGPSAGLMFTLQIYDQLTGGHLRRNRVIAGTGTIEPDGTVGAIGGIDKKIVAASKAGASVFFAPNDTLTKAERKADPHYVNNYQTAKRTAKQIHTNMKIIPVKKLTDAVDYLK